MECHGEQWEFPSKADDIDGMQWNVWHWQSFSFFWIYLFYIIGVQAEANANSLQQSTPVGF